MKIGFIGGGNMASAIIRGIISSELLLCDEIYVFDVNREKAEELSKKFNINKCDNYSDIINNSDYVVLAVKPNIFPDLIGEIREDIKAKNSPVISIAAGKTISYISDLFSYDAKIFRIMPNINATVGEAMSAYCYNERVTEDEISFVDKFCSSFGQAVSLPESQFSIFSVISGCAPAFAYMFIDTLARAAVKNGMNKNDALKIATQTVFGSAKQIKESDMHPWQLVDMVCSPGGTTIEGVSSLQENGFEATIQKAVQSSYEKDKSL